MSDLLIAYHDGNLSEPQLDARIASNVGASAQRVATLPRIGAYLLRVVVESDAPSIADRLSAPDLRVFRSRPLLPICHYRRQPRKLGPGDPSVTPPPHANLPPRGVALAVLDADGFYEHPVFEGRLKLFDATGPAVREDGDGYAVPRPKLGQSEGTAVASVAAGAEPCAGPARCAVWGFLTKETAHMVQAMEYILERNAADGRERSNVRVVVTAWKVALEDGEKPAAVGFEQTLEKLADDGVLFVAAAGNTGLLGEAMAPPAVLPGVIAVGGFEDIRPTGPGVGDRVHDDSTRGPAGERKPETLAPYDNWVVAPEVPELAVHAGRGTSLAAGFVAGVLATLVQANGSLNRGKLRQLLALPGVSEDLGAAINEQGFGALKVDQARAQVGVV
jgi:hypothetical protein